jgi:carboxylesterase type B
MPPVTPSTWKNTRLADHFSPVCPQTVPVTDTGMEALLEMPRGRLAQLRRMKPLLTNYSEDCLYLNMYIPREGEFLFQFINAASLINMEIDFASLNSIYKIN